MVLEVLRKERLSGNLKKCTFCADSVVFLGFVVGANGIQVDEEKIKAIQEWPSPKTVGEVRSLYGLAGFYRRFVKDFSTLVVIKKDVGFKWDAAQEEAFQLLKDRLTHAPLLSLPDLLKLLKSSVMLQMTGDRAVPTHELNKNEVQRRITKGKAVAVARNGGTSKKPSVRSGGEPAAKRARNAELTLVPTLEPKRNGEQAASENDGDELRAIVPHEPDC
ncbi:uncharacterized protein LOC112086228, partial [Eutrema salsugineum]|uniref:uncharacterized protein LOC112086228 n=1 Tax=Eutrema salsugineum TaxID=72664 RepID=UPI000CED4F1D